MKLKCFIFTLLFSLCWSSANAMQRGGYVAVSNFAPSTSKSGFVLTDSSMFPFVNFMKMADSANSLGTNWPAFLNSTNLPTGTTTSTLSYTDRLPANHLGKYVLALTGTLSSGGGLVLNLNGTQSASGQIYSASGATLTGCTNSNVPPCAFGNTVKISGTNPTITFDFSTAITGATSNAGVVHLVFSGAAYSTGQAVTVSGVVGSDGNGCGANGGWKITNATSTGADLVGSTFPGGCTYSSGGQIFPFAPVSQEGPSTNTAGSYVVGFNFSTGTYSGMSGIILCKQADYNVDNTCNTTAGKPQWTTDGFNDDFITNLASANPHHLRFLDVNNSVFRLGGDYADWTPTTSWSYSLTNSYWAMARWFGADSGTNSYSISCTGSCTYTLTGGAPVDGDMFQFYNGNGNGSANPTLTITDKNSTTSSAIPIFDESADHLTVRLGNPTATLLGSISGTTLTVNTLIAGTIHVGDIIQNTLDGGLNGNVIVSGSGSTWTLSGSFNDTNIHMQLFSENLTSGDTVALQYSTTSLGAWTCLSTAHTTSSYTINSTPAASFNGTISGTTLTITSGSIPSNALGGTVFGSGVTANSLLLQQTDSTHWVLSQSSTTGAGIALTVETPANVANKLVAVVANDSTLLALPLGSNATNPLSNGTFFIGYANNACNLTVTSVLTGSATETITIGRVDPGLIRSNQLYTGVYNQLMGGIIVNTFFLGSGLSESWPWSTQINLAKAISIKSGSVVGCWLQFPIYWSIASVQALATYENANQCPGGVFNEYGNEIWNPGNLMAGQAGNLAYSIGIPGGNFQAYQGLRNRQFFGAEKTIYGSIGSHFLPTQMFQQGNGQLSSIQGTTLCGTSCSNPAYQTAIGVDYNSAPNQPLNFLSYVGQAPYYNGSIIGAYSGPFGTWSATSSSISGSVLNVTGTVTGTIWWNQGVASCNGVYLQAPTPSNPSSVQLTGSVTTTLNGATSENQITNIVLTSVAGIQTGMWMFNSTTGFPNGIVSSINNGASSVNVVNNGFKSAGAHDTVVFGGKDGTYQLNSTSCSASSGTITGGDILGLQAAADDYNGINSALGSQDDALKWVYQDVYISTVNGKQNQSSTLQAVVDNVNLMTSNIANPASLAVADYEGGLQVIFPTTSQATGIGLPSSAYGDRAGYVAQLIYGFYNSTYAYNAEILRHTLELSGLPANSMTMYYVYSSNFPWGLFPAGLYSTPYQPFNAVKYYNTH